MDDPVLIIYSVIITLILAAVMVVLDVRTENCEKTHNVYKCELVAVPVEPKHE